MGRYVPHAGSIEFSWVGFTFQITLKTLSGDCETSTEVEICFGSGTTESHRFAVSRFTITDSVNERHVVAPGREHDVVELRKTFQAEKDRCIKLPGIYPSCGNMEKVYQFIQETEDEDWKGSVEDSRVELVSIKLPEEYGLEQPKSDSRKILIFGDSDSAGFGTLTQCIIAPGWKNSNTREAWSSRTAKLLAADAEILAVSGVGMARCPENSSSIEPMPALAWRAYPFSDTAKTDWIEPIPDAVIIELGANDFLPYGAVMGESLDKFLITPLKTAEVFTNAYSQFLDEVIEKYASAQIFAMVGGSGDWIDERNYNEMQHAITNAVNTARSHYAVNKIHIVEVGANVLHRLQEDKAKYVRCQGHWSPAGHEEIAFVIAPQIAKAMQDAQVGPWTTAWDELNYLMEHRTSQIRDPLNY